MIKPTLLHEWNGEELAGWWLSEKYDGVRMVWDGSRLFTREGIVINAPAWFTADLPPVALDGELWLGHGTLSRAKSLVNSLQAPESKWRLATFMVFDLPIAEMRFEERIDRLNALPLGRYAHLVHHRLVASTADAVDRCRDIIKDGGEGVVVRCMNSRYWFDKRSYSWLKMKRKHLALRFA